MPTSGLGAIPRLCGSAIGLQAEGCYSPLLRLHLPQIRMNKERLIPLIVATALFMENMDSTVIATSLPAIAADIGTSPLTLKLAITSYLLSLAVFIPASGWTADRFGARMVFAIADRRVHGRARSAARCPPPSPIS